MEILEEPVSKKRKVMETRSFVPGEAPCRPVGRYRKLDRISEGAYGVVCMDTDFCKHSIGFPANSFLLLVGCILV
jgi:hypothetical protein